MFIIRGNSMIDLHTHTIFSDGTWTLEEMLTNAEKANISILAITDHDTALPHIKLKDIDIKKFFSGRVIVGGLRYDESLKYPTKIIYNDITKYKENKKFFTDKEWSIREAFFRSCTCNPNFILYRNFSKQYPSAEEVSKQIRKARRKSILSTFVFIFIR